MTEDHTFETYLNISVSRMLRETIESDNMTRIMHEDTLPIMQDAKSRLLERYGQGPAQSFAFILTVQNFLQGELMKFALSMAIKDFLLNPQLEIKNAETLIIEGAEMFAKGIVEATLSSLNDNISEKLNVRNEVVFKDIEKVVKLKRGANASSY